MSPVEGGVGWEVGGERDSVCLVTLREPTSVVLSTHESHISYRQFPKQLTLR